MNRLTIETRFDLEDLIAAYCHNYDNKDMDSFSALFMPDAPFQIYNAAVLETDSSFDQLVDVFKSRMDMHKEMGVQTRHYQTNPRFMMGDDGRVHATMNLLIQHQHADESVPRTVHTGLYKSVFEETMDGWKYARHEIHIDHGS